MKKLIAALFLLSGGLPLFAQTVEKSISTSPPVKFSAAENYMPYLFEPYQADYIFKGKIIGIPLKIFSSSTRIIELRDEWEETQKIRLEFMDYFPGANLDKETFREMEMTSNIDLKTGLLKGVTARLANNPNGSLNVSFAEEGKIIVTGTDGARTEKTVYANREKIYPCSFSNTFLSYLPLNDNFSGTFACLELDKDDFSNKDVVRFSKRTLRVVGTESVTVDAGTFECYKLADETEEIKYGKDGTIKKTVKIGKRAFNEDEFWKNFYNNLWIDKKSRKLVKAELLFKGGNLTLEMQKPRFDNL